MPQFQILDMTCKHCEATITHAIQELDAQAIIEVDLSAQLVKIESKEDPSTLETAIREAGYSPVAI